MGEGGEGGRRAPLGSVVVCEYDYISIDACIVQFGGGEGAQGLLQFRICLSNMDILKARTSIGFPCGKDSVLKE